MTFLQRRHRFGHPIGSLAEVVPNLANFSEPASRHARGYLERVNRAIDHIVSHLEEPMRLWDLVPSREALAVPLPSRVPGSCRSDAGRIREAPSPREGAGPHGPFPHSVANLDCASLRVFFVVRLLTEFQAALRRGTTGVRPPGLAQARGEELEATVKETAQRHRLGRVPPGSIPTSSA